MSNDVYIGKLLTFPTPLVWSGIVKTRFSSNVEKKMIVRLSSAVHLRSHASAVVLISLMKNKSAGMFFLMVVSCKARCPITFMMSYTYGPSQRRQMCMSLDRSQKFMNLWTKIGFRLSTFSFSNAMISQHAEQTKATLGTRFMMRYVVYTVKLALCSTEVCFSADCT